VGGGEEMGGALYLWVYRGVVGRGGGENAT